MAKKLADQQIAERLRNVAESTLRQFELNPERSLEKFRSIVLELELL